MDSCQARSLFINHIIMDLTCLRVALNDIQLQSASLEVQSPKTPRKKSSWSLNNSPKSPKRFRDLPSRPIMTQSLPVTPVKTKIIQSVTPRRIIKTRLFTATVISASEEQTSTETIRDVDERDLSVLDLNEEEDLHEESLSVLSESRIMNSSSDSLLDEVIKRVKQVKI